MKKYIFGVILSVIMAVYARAGCKEDCEKAVENRAAEHYKKEIRYGELRTKPKSVEIRGSTTSEIIPGVRYKTSAEANITYAGTTGGDTNEVRHFAMTVEVEDDGKLSLLKFEEIDPRQK